MAGRKHADHNQPPLVNALDADDDDEITVVSRTLLRLGSGSRAGSEALGPSGVGGLRWLSALIVAIVLIVVLLMVVVALVS